MLVTVQDGKPVACEPCAQGWLEHQSVTRRPVDLLRLDHGAMLVGDDFSGKLYRGIYQPPTTDKYGDL